MNILVVNGSPKGEYSITLQTIKYLEKHFPQYNFQVLHAGQKIKAKAGNLMSEGMLMPYKKLLEKDDK